MKKSFVYGAALAVALGALATPPAHAACGQDAVPVNQLFVPMINCPDAVPPTGGLPASMYAYLLSNPASANSNGQDGICYDATKGTGIGQGCDLSLAGAPGDGNIVVQYDWGSFNTGSVGCPSSAQTDGDAPLGISVITSNGTGAFITVGFSTLTAGYVVDLAFPYDAGTGSPDPIPCTPSMAPAFVSASGGTTPGTVANVCVHVPAPQIVSDCDPNSTSVAGLGGGSCLTPGTKPTASFGRLYTKEVACKSATDLRTAQGWTLLPVLPDASGNACNNITRPTDTTHCAYIGTTSTIGGTESPAITGVLQIAPQAASGDKVKINSASLDQGKLNVDYATENEMTIVGFNVYAGSAKLNASLISAKGTGSNSYSFSVGRGAVKNNRTVTVEAVLSSGGTVKSNTVTLK